MTTCFREISIAKKEVVSRGRNDALHKDNPFHHLDSFPQFAMNRTMNSTTNSTMNSVLEGRMKISLLGVNRSLILWIFNKEVARWSKSNTFYQMRGLSLISKGIR